MIYGLILNLEEQGAFVNLEAWAVNLRCLKVLGKFQTNQVGHDSRMDVLTKLEDWYHPLSLTHENTMLIYFDDVLLDEIFGKYGSDQLKIWDFYQF